MFSLPAAEDTEGSSDNNPIRLDGIKKEEFKRFLEVLFMGACEETTKPGPIFETWFPVVKLARMWEFDGIYKCAIKNMPYNQISKTSAEKVGLAVKYDIQPWLLPGLNELVKRKEPLGNHDLEVLGPEVALKVAAVRESLIIGNYDAYGRPRSLASGSRDASNVDFTSVIKRVFQISGNGTVNEKDGVGEALTGSNLGLQYGNDVTYVESSSDFF